MTSVSTGRRERLRRYGADQLSTDELLALVIGAGSRGRPALALARALLAGSGGVASESRAPLSELAAVPGVGPAQAARIAAAFHLGRRALETTNAPGQAIDCADAVHRRLRGRMAGLSQEVFVALALDARNGVIEEVEIARGSLTGVEVHPRELFRPLIRVGAAAVVVAHNHPSGDPRPSPEDRTLTERVRQVGELVGIPLLDHVIIAGERYESLAERMGL